MTPAERPDAAGGDRHDRPRPGRQTLTTDGPFVEIKEALGGYLFLEADDLDARHRARVADPRGAHGRARSRCARSWSGSADLDQVFRDEWGRVLASLIGFLGDFDLAEEAAQEAFAIAAERWPRDGAPANPARLARRARPATARSTASAATARWPPRPACSTCPRPSNDPIVDDDMTIPDERLELVFTCCHPALATDAQVALTLRTLGGLDDRARSRAPSSSARSHDGAAPGARQAQDQDRRDPVPGAARSPAARAARPPCSRSST